MQVGVYRESPLVYTQYQDLAFIIQVGVYRESPLVYTLSATKPTANILLSGYLRGHTIFTISEKYTLNRWLFGCTERFSNIYFHLAKLMISNH
jgi:hypothetical protein